MPNGGRPGRRCLRCPGRLLSVLMGACGLTVAGGIPSVLGQSIVAGYVEVARISPPGIELKAKLDTGALHSSLDARRIEQFERAGAQWVTFEIPVDGRTSSPVTVPLLRAASVRRHGGRVQTRPVVRLEICLGSVRRTVEVNLIDRSGYVYPLLIGRSFLAAGILVDAARTQALALRCQ